MANLRSLLGTQSTSVTGIYSGGVGRLKPGQSYWIAPVNQCRQCGTIDTTTYNSGNALDARGCPGLDNYETIHYNSYILCCWKPPYGATRIDFELWGAGGGGATACCCSVGVPGGAGAYSKMTVRPGLGSVTSGIGSDWSYTIYTPHRTCNGGNFGGVLCTPAPRPHCHGSCEPGDIPGITLNRGPVQGQGGMTGYAGSDAWAVGCGLENFCAQGGVPGCAFCWMPWGDFITGFNSMPVGAAATHSSSGHTVTGLGTDCVGCCAMFYGCSGSGAGINTACGAPGLPGAYAMRCSACRYWNKHYVPYPGGLVNKCGGYIVAQQCGDRCCNCEYQSFIEGRVGFGGGGLHGGYVPGMGGMSGSSCAPNAPAGDPTPCCCGTVGRPGAARITVYYD